MDPVGGAQFINVEGVVYAFPWCVILEICNSQTSDGIYNNPKLQESVPPRFPWSVIDPSLPFAGRRDDRSTWASPMFASTPRLSRRPVVGFASRRLCIVSVAHIFVGSKANWHKITDDVPQFEEFPPR